MGPAALSGRRLTASRGIVSDLHLEWFESGWTHGDGLTRGYRVEDQAGRTWNDADLDEVGVHVLRVNGVSYHEAALQAEAFDPGERVILMPEPNNRHDPWALSVRDLSAATHVGYVPATRSRALVEELRFRPLHAISLTEHRVGGRRVGLRVVASFARLLAG